MSAGAGKTSLLCALAGKASYGRVTGRVYVNRRLDQLERYKKVRLTVLIFLLHPISCYWNTCDILAVVYLSVVH